MDIFPKCGKLLFWGPVMPCGDMHQSVTDAHVYFFGHTHSLLYMCPNSLLESAWRGVTHWLACYAQTPLVQFVLNLLHK